MENNINPSWATQCNSPAESREGEKTAAHAATGIRQSSEVKHPK